MAVSRICSVDGCGKRSIARGWCQMHYRRWRLYGDVSAKQEQVAKVMCEIDGCGEAKKIRKGLCPKHYYRYRQHGDPYGGDAFRHSRREMVDWIEAHIGHADDECLIWPFARFQNGYGSAYDEDGRHVVASRLMCRKAHGAPDREFFDAAHSCGNGEGGCVHPKHLRWATPSENMADKIVHGTTLRGEAHPQAKISRDDVIAIRSLTREMPQSEIARRFGISFQHVSDILLGRRWSWLE